jgi:hypothetical protein
MTKSIPLNGFQEVSKRHYFEFLSKHEVSLSLVGDYPYTKECKTSNGEIICKVVGYYANENKYPVILRYYIADKGEQDEGSSRNN